MCRERGRKRGRREGEVVPKIYQKANQKSSINQPKIDQEERENPPKNQSEFGPKSILEGSWKGRRPSWRPRPTKSEGDNFFGTLLGPSWRPLGADLAASWGRLGGLGGLLSRLGPSKNRCQNRSKIECLLGSVFVGIRVDFGKKNGAKLVPKWDPTWGSLKIRKKPIGASPLAPIEVGRSQLGAKIDQKSTKT